MDINFAQLVVSVAVVLIVLHTNLMIVPYVILLERKVASWTQDRIGPNRVGLTFGLLPNNWHMFGLGQPLADGIKFLVKEDFNPRAVDKVLFFVAPMLAVIPAMIGWAVVPWGGVWQSETWGTLHVTAMNVNIGVIYILAIGSLAVYGVVLGAWASNNKYSFLGGLRATAQMLSYEIPMGLIVLCILLMAGSAHAAEIVNQQVGYWFGFIPQWLVFQQPLAAILFFVCILAESNRAPFDLAEAEQELVGGYHTEYSSMKFALFFLGEYMHMITASAFMVVLFLGGWHLPWIDLLLTRDAQPVATGLGGVALKFAVFFGKVVFLMFVMIWIRWTIPRFRFDQLMKLAWRSLIPLALLLLMVTGVMVFLGLRDWLWAGNLGVIILALAVAPLIPSDPSINRRVPLAGSRFNPLTDAPPR